MAILQLAKAVAEGQIKLTLADLDRLIRLEAYLCDEPESRQEVIVHDLQSRKDDELREMIAQEVTLLREIADFEDVVLE